MSESLQIQVSHADVGRRFDQLVIGLVVLASVVALVVAGSRQRRRRPA